jgi:TRAP-type C4-dicarboxylate transport system permease large subunit
MSTLGKIVLLGAVLISAIVGMAMMAVLGYALLTTPWTWDTGYDPQASGASCPRCD